MRHPPRGSLGTADRLGRALGWFSIGLGLVQIAAPSRVSRALGMRGQEGLMRMTGAREVASGLLSLSVDRGLGLRARLAGDAMDAVSLAMVLGRGRGGGARAGVALAAVAGIALVDLLVAQSLAKRHGRERARAMAPLRRHHGDRSGFPGGLARARGAAADFPVPPDLRATPEAPRLGS
ncbi:hypothetical protein [Falsiroseomonas selenitidurans]|uniref:DUF4267 domain-containing protein n=1 Tax=Falsiroseomonas selenitidurans TaxID=2716335 RepID=A0ABX1EBH1_9PROT|nr:hypothetical protein [Falsiroseomonas selenitidurans]NKC32260.1 hypothetical protein [Falsiroseomonas selenitidurans]